jgi:peptidoglycan/xylan/chitin deacetylase (PgdA/CDA1 family)
MRAHRLFSRRPAIALACLGLTAIIAACGSNPGRPSPSAAASSAAEPGASAVQAGGSVNVGVDLGTGTGVSGAIGGAGQWLPSPPTPATASALALRLRVPILMYHLIGGADDPRALPGLVVPTALFRAQLDALRSAGWRSIGLDSLAAALNGGPMPGPRSFVITVDDGHEDGFTQALPVLQALGDTATFFVITDRIGRSGYLSAGQLRAMTADGMEIGNHTFDHHNVTTLSMALARADIDRAQATLGVILGRSPELFAYPAGKANPSAESDVQSAGIQLAVGEKPGALEDLADRYLLPRIRVSPSMAPERLLADLDAAIGGRPLP